MEEVKQLRVKSRGEACVVHARGVTEASKAQDSLQKGVASMQLKEQLNSTKVLGVIIFLLPFSLLVLFPPQSCCCISCLTLLVLVSSCKFEVVVYYENTI